MQTAVVSDQGELIAAQVRVANTFLSRLIGLLDMSRMDEEEGLWLAPGGSIHTFAMRFPIDVLFLDGEGRVLLYRHAVKPWRIALAPRRTRYVLELAAGRVRKLQRSASKVSLHHDRSGGLPCRARVHEQ
ncbi:MAG TPA: DUF192 domain-containing protein [Steroidobacteraceae bacterium]|jgi:uncharacterized membrane protein (UPF0127 family)|nr:DUF192 domain-containing protein [Steroidobacteraceae bacterium]